MNKRIKQEYLELKGKNKQKEYKMPKKDVEKMNFLEKIKNIFVTAFCEALTKNIGKNELRFLEERFDWLL